MAVIKLTLEYDGTDFAGWQVQLGFRTVQSIVESSLEQIAGRPIHVVASGRTDSGVHALGQVISFHEVKTLPLKAYRLGLNQILPKDVCVVEAEYAPADFNARKSAVKRTYRYVFQKKRGVIGRQYAWYPGCDLNIRLLKKAGKVLLGEHDFASFCKKGNEKSTCSKILSFVWKETEEFTVCEITGIRFFHNMIRIILGTLLEMNKGHISMEDLKNILKAKDRNQAGPTIPPQGLYLVKVHY